MKIHCYSGAAPGVCGMLMLMAAGIAAADGLRADTSTYNFANLAGNAAILDHTNGTGSNARFFDPVAAATDASGNIYVADAGDHTLREITAGGVVSTLAGNSGQAGTADGTGSGALFLYPYAVAVDAAGNVYVADLGANTIRKVTPTGAVSTLAGSPGVAGSSDGAGGAALFNGPQGIAVDAEGDVYVSDTNNSTIRKITPTGGVTTLAGSAGLTGGNDGTTNGARFNYPGGLAIDTAGNLYVADFDNSTIRKVTAAGVVSTLAGSAGLTGTTDGQGAAARFNHPNGVAVDSFGNVYVADTSNQTVRMISPAGAVTTLAGMATIGGRVDGTGMAARFFYPNGIAATASGAIYVADTGNHTVRAVTGTGGVSTYAGGVGVIGSANGNGTSATFNYPDGIAVDGSDNVYVADQNNNEIRKISASGSVATLAGTAGPAGSTDGSGAVALFNAPGGVAVDSSGNVYVADTGNSTIRKITAAGAVSTFAGVAGAAGAADGTGIAARFNQPQGIAVDSLGNVYVADTNNDTIRKIATTGAVSTLAGVAGQPGSGDGPGGGAHFNEPHALAVDGSGNIYVADYGNGTIRMVTSAGLVSTLAGTAGLVGDADATGPAARFNQVNAIAVDAGGDVYVADTFNRCIRKIMAGGVVTTINGAQSRFYYPQGLAVDGSGNLYVADGDNQAVAVGVPIITTTANSFQMGSHTVAPGQSTTFTFGSPAVGTTYQWQVSTDGGVTWNNVANGALYGGATTTALAITSPAAAMNGYQYRLVLNTATTSSATNGGTLYVGTVRLTNLSSRGFVGAGSPLVAGVFLNGTGSKQLLIRGIGPTLASFNVQGPLLTPSLTLFNSAGSPIATDNAWGGGPTLANAFLTLGAFALPASSADSALYLPVPVSGSTSYTAQVSGINGSTGVALVELYDADTGTPATRMVNLSTRVVVGTGSNILVVGFVITGNTSETVLIRGDGPALGLAPFNLAGPLANPVLTLSNSSGATVATNAGWGGTTALVDASNEVGAFTLSPSSADSALLISLPPGSYTAQLTGNGSTSGLGLLEIYEVR